MTDREKLLEEVLDPNKVSIYCGTHNYFGPTKPGQPEVKPGQNCPKCWTVLYLHDIATTPPAQRAQRLDELEEVIHKATELAARGMWDYEPLRHSKIEMESN